MSQENELYQFSIRPIRKSDCQMISDCFRAQGWDKSVGLFEQYYRMQASGESDVLIAEYDGVFSGFVTIFWESIYTEFRNKHIPEIVDLNVLMKYQRKGIATTLLDEVEARIKNKSALAGIGFGVTQDYGAAQIMYIRRGYVPDGNGLVTNNRPVVYGDQIIVDDGLVFYLIKKL